MSATENRFTFTYRTPSRNTTTLETDDAAELRQFVDKVIEIASLHGAIDMPRKPPVHGPAKAVYVHGGDGLVPCIECLCGWSYTAYGGSWEEAGGAFDDHLVE